MKKRFYPLIIGFILTLLTYNVNAQNSNCLTAAPICPDYNIQFPLTPGALFPSSNTYCFNPWAAQSGGWFYFQVTQSGDLDLQLVPESGGVQATVYGPFPSVTMALSSCGSLNQPLNCINGQNNGYVNINNATAGDFYVMAVIGSELYSQFSLQQFYYPPYNTATLNCNLFGDIGTVCPPLIILDDCEDELPDPFENFSDFLIGGGTVTGACNFFFPNAPRIAVSGKSLGSNDASGCPEDEVVYTREYYLADNCGNIGKCTQQILVPPSTEAPYVVPVNLAVSCPDEISLDTVDIFIIADCGVEYSYEIGEPVIKDAIFGVTCDFTCYHYPVTVTDDCGRMTVSEIGFTVVGNDPIFQNDINPHPDICEIAPLIKECGDPFVDHDQLIEDWLDNVVALGTCGQEVNITTSYSEDNFIDTCGYGGIQVVTFTATDECGRTATCTGTIFSLDTKEPLFFLDPKDKTVDCANADAEFQDWLDSYAGAEAIDCCGSITYSYEPTNPTLELPCDGGDGATTVTFFATDECGLSISEEATFTVSGTANLIIDTQAAGGTFTCDGDIEEAFNDWLANNGGLMVSGGCGTITYSTMPANPTLPNICGGTTEVNFIASSSCGDQIMSTASFTVNDNTAPSISFNNDLLNGLANGSTLTVECDNVPVFSESDVIAMDDCDDAVSVVKSTSTQMGDCTTNGFIELITCSWTATDLCGNATTVTIFIEVTDTTPPVFTSIPTDDSGTATATDNCDDNVEVTFMDMMGAGQCDIIRTFKATDHCGNMTTAILVLGTGDSNPPSFTFVPADMTVDCNDPIQYGTPQATDAEGSVSITSVESGVSGNCINNGNGGTGFNAISVMTITWTATDDCGNTATATQSITSVDNTPPVFTFVPDETTIFCSTGEEIGDAIATDDCGNVTVTFVDEINTGAVEDNCNNGYGYDIYRTFTATDQCGNATTVETVHWFVPDGYTGPGFTFVPESRMIECGEDPQFEDAQCSSFCGDVVLTFEDSQTIGDCSQGSFFTRTWTGIDACGNVATASQTLTIPEDTEAPVFTFVPTNQTIACGETMAFGTPTCTDNCSTINHLDVSYEDIELTDQCSVQRIWTVADLCGNVATASQTLIIEDNMAPSFNYTLEDKVIACGEAIAFDTPVAMDECGMNTTVDLQFSDEEIQSDCAVSYTMKRTWTATDQCGNVSNLIQNITVEDNEVPYFTFVPESKIVECTDLPEFGEAYAEDACSEIEMEFFDEDIIDYCNNGNSYKRTWRVTDACGNVVEASQTFSTTPDNEAPTFIEIPSDKTYQCGEVIGFDNPIAIDVCSGVELTFEEEAITGACSNTTSQKRTWTATDGCGNMATISQTLSLEDNIAPTFETVLENKIVDCNAAFEFDTPVALDDCGEVELTYEESAIANDECQNATSMKRIWTATDQCGNVSLSEQIISFEDNTAPTFETTLSDKTMDCGQEMQFDTPTADDLCGNVELSFVDETFENDCASSYSVKRTWTATDDCGNASQLEQTITMEDNTAPEIFGVPNDITLECDEIGNIEGFNAYAQDNCDNSVAISLNESTEAGTCEGSFKIIRTFTATDNCGNVTQLKYNITIEDNTAPIFETVLNNQTIQCGTEMQFDTPIASDLCGNVQLSFIDETFENDCTGSYSVKRTWTATDICGNATQLEQTITMEDNTPPSFETVLNNQTIQCGTEMQFDTPVANDFCSNVELSFADETFENDCANSYSVKRIWTATDECGNATQLEQTITMEDITAPEFTSTPESKTLECGQEVVFDTPEASDFCSEVELTHSDEYIEGACISNLTQIRTWVATDECGNATEISQSITIADNTAPEFTSVPEDKYISCGEAIEFDDMNATDSCNELEIMITNEVVTETCETIHTRTWRALDYCGNATSISQTIYQQDEEAPVFDNAPIDLEMTYAEYQNWTVPTVTASDDCTNVAISNATIENIEDCENFSFDYTWEATDECGNQRSHTMHVYITDVLPAVELAIPNEVDCGSTISLNPTLLGGITPFEFDWTLMDGEDWSILTIDEEEITINAGTGEAVIQLNITNEFGCSDTYSFDIECDEATTTSTNDIFGNNGFEISPNPASDYLNINFYANDHGEVEILIHDILGRTIQNQIVEYTLGDNNSSLNISQLTQGTYIVLLKVGKEFHQKKFIKQ